VRIVAEAATQLDSIFDIAMCCIDAFLRGDIPEFAENYANFMQIFVIKSFRLP
jgi:hypothetical protein